MKTVKILFLLAVLAIGVHSCKKDSSSGKASLAVRMTDAPAAYDAVYIDLQSVVVTGAGGDVVLNVSAGIYNLLDFSNGLDTLIATGSIDAGKVEQIRLVLGPNNSIVVNGTTYPLSTPSAEQSGLKLQIHETYEAGVSYAILLDFDAHKSIVETGNGSYKLKPVIRTINAAISGSVKGVISTPGIIATVTATSSGGVTYTSVTNLAGQFVIAGLPAGTYDITVTPPLGLSVTVTGVVVTTGASTDVGVVTL